MPRKKRKYTKRTPSSKPEIIEHPVPRQGITAYTRPRNTFFTFYWAESYVSLLMGVVIIIIAVLSVVTLIRATHHVQDTSSVATGPTPTTAPMIQQVHNKNVYVVQAGDDLWHIAQKQYGDGDKWVDIAKANNLSDPSMIFSGNQLILPEIAQAQPATATNQLSQTITQQEVKAITIKGDNYTVESGDDLWDIAVRAYADGYRWVDIAKANNLSDPSTIHSGNVLIIPR